MGPAHKQLRTEHEIGLKEAEGIALADSDWCRWVEHQINTDLQCQRMALRHICERGPDALIERAGDKLRARSS